MSYHTCYNCMSKISTFARVCPQCHTDPYTKVDHSRDRRDQEAANRRAEELHREQMREVRQRDGGSTSGGAGSGSGWFWAGLFILAIVVAIFTWIGERIALRFGAGTVGTVSVILLIGLVAACYSTYRLLDRRPELTSYAPVASWVAVLLLILFLPDSIAFARKSAPPQAVAEPSRSAGPSNAPTASVVSQMALAAPDADEHVLSSSALSAMFSTSSNGVVLTSKSNESGTQFTIQCIYSDVTEARATETCRHRLVTPDGAVVKYDVIENVAITGENRFCNPAKSKADVAAQYRSARVWARGADGSWSDVTEQGRAWLIQSSQPSDGVCWNVTGDPRNPTLVDDDGTRYDWTSHSPGTAAWLSDQAWKNGPEDFES